MAARRAALAAKSGTFCEKLLKKWGSVTETQMGTSASAPRVRFVSRATGASPPALQYFLQISSFFFFNLGNPPRISRICSEISPAGLGISRPGRNPPNLATPNNRFRQIFLPSKIFLVGWKLSKSLIPDVLELLPDFKSPQPNGYFECRGFAHWEDP